MAPHEDDILRSAVDSDTSSTERVKLVIRKRMHGRRLDKYLHGRFPRLSRTLIQRLIRQGDIVVNGQPTKPSYEPGKNDVVEMCIPPPEPTDIAAEDIPLDVVYEDEHLLVINKQSGIICHPARPSQGGTIANAVVAHCEKVSRGSDPCRPGIVHRLDKNTTGVMLIAKNDETHWRLSLQFERRTVQKHYLAIVEGEVQLDEDIIDAPLSAHPTIKDRYMVPGMPKVAMISKQALTTYHVAERFQGYTLLEMRPKTGRTHQLRVHASFIGYPIVGDLSYGGHPISEHMIRGDGAREPLIMHQALHAWRISFVHPMTEQRMELRAPLPARMEYLLNLLRAFRSV